MAAANARTYVDFAPLHTMQEEADKVVLRVDLTAEGFKKEQLRVQIDNFGRLRISGERPLRADSNRWRRFSKDFQVPEGCDAGAIRARLDKGGVLLITMPRLSPAPAKEEPKPTPTAAGAKADAVTGQDKQKGDTSAHQEKAAAAAEAGEENKEDAGDDASMERRDQHEQRTTDDAGAAPLAGRQKYGLAMKPRRKVWAIFAVVLALVGAGLFARYRLMDPSSETAPAGNAVAVISDTLPWRNAEDA